ncbi:MAG: flagellar hook capping protein [Alicyclobacillus herbarius]|uniref:flagellar hook capping FlgD N-terminal domain-containing protein n=1 Tax=Alicyclobacillus herbarius TaxID=122960 RepID=UPI00042A3451|nr:flagellar hook capping FlgD N-terminal domain-containing protein [Alicyclobacillus herbarius]MCL6631982.1 flagellar hook capping protein [Alicyclobacillus herbarius]
MTTSSVPAPGGDLGKDAFLQMMVTQMQYQDPLQPMDNSQFLAQLAQFSALEQMTNVAQTDNSVLSAVQSLVGIYQSSYAYQLLGSQVQVQGKDGAPVSGVVTAVRYVDGTPQLVINGNSYSLSDLQEVTGANGT